MFNRLASRLRIARKATGIGGSFIYKKIGRGKLDARKFRSWPHIHGSIGASVHCGLAGDQTAESASEEVEARVAAAGSSAV
jgi:hypothetical protein